MNMHLPPFLGRLLRPFTHSSRLSIAADSPVSVNSLPEGIKRCTVAAGCFWGTEHLYRKHFAGKGLVDTKVGYIGGDLDNPSYRAICGGKTGRKFPLPHQPTVITFFLGYSL
jgi:peptide-methionine (S)-S-oxide reductase